MSKITDGGELFDVDQESTGWTREITFFYKGVKGKLLLAWHTYEGYTNFEFMERPTFDTLEQVEEFYEWFEDTTEIEWDLATHKWEEEN